MENNAKGQDMIATGQTVQKCFTQDEVNHLISMRVKRERNKLEKEFESRVVNCFSDIWQAMQEESASMKPESLTATKDTLLSRESPNEHVEMPVSNKADTPSADRNTSVIFVDLSANDGHVLHYTLGPQRCSCRRHMRAGRHRRRVAAKLARGKNI